MARIPSRKESSARLSSSAVNLVKEVSSKGNSPRQSAIMERPARKLSNPKMFNETLEEFMQSSDNPERKRKLGQPVKVP